MCFILVSLFVVRLGFMSACHKIHMSVYIVVLIIFTRVRKTPRVLITVSYCTKLYYSFLALLAPGPIGFL